MKCTALPPFPQLKHLHTPLLGDTLNDGVCLMAINTNLYKRSKLYDLLSKIIKKKDDENFNMKEHVDKALEIIEKYNIKTFVEIGVGSGAISAAILKNTKNTNAIATDISKAAINIARHNMEAMNLTNRCELVESNLLQSPYMSSMNIQMLISNPPYIANNYPLNKEVLHEPHTALFGGKNGDEILKELLYQARQKEIPIILCEMGYDQRDSMSETLSGLGYDTEFYLDLSGLDRGFVAYIR